MSKATPEPIPLEVRSGAQAFDRPVLTGMTSAGALGLTAPWLRWSLSICLGLAALTALELSARRHTAQPVRMQTGVAWVRLASQQTTVPPLPARKPVTSQGRPENLEPLREKPALSEPLLSQHTPVPPETRQRETAIPDAREASALANREPLATRLPLPAPSADPDKPRPPSLSEAVPQTVPQTVAREVRETGVRPPLAPSPVAAVNRPLGESIKPRRKEAPAEFRESKPIPQADPLPSRPAHRIVNPADLDAGFELVGSVSPRFPERARRLKRGGQVQLEVLIDEEGQVNTVRVVSETAGWGFGAAAREAFTQARFTPPTASGRPVRVLWHKTLIFRP